MIEGLGVVIRYCLPVFFVFLIALVAAHAASIKFMRYGYTDVKSLVIGNALNSGFKGFTGIALLLTALSVDTVILWDSELTNLVIGRNSILDRIEIAQFSSYQLFFVTIFLHFVFLFIVTSMCQTALGRELANKRKVLGSPYNIIHSPEKRVTPHYDVTSEEFWGILENTRDRFRRFVGDIIGAMVLSSSLMLFFCRL